jgi:hypothetical protein
MRNIVYGVGTSLDAQFKNKTFLTIKLEKQQDK